MVVYFNSVDYSMNPNNDDKPLCHENMFRNYCNIFLEDVSYNIFYSEKLQTWTLVVTYYDPVEPGGNICVLLYKREYN